MKIVVVTNQQAGVGKTAITMQLASVMSRRCRLLVVDGERQQSAVWWAGNVGQRIPFGSGGDQLQLLMQLRRAHMDCDFMLVDTPGGLEGALALERALDAADYALVPLVPDPVAVEPTLRTVGRFIEPRHLRYAIVLNRIDAGVTPQLHTWQDLLDTTLGIPRFDAYLDQHGACFDELAFGRRAGAVADNRHAGPSADALRLGSEMIDQFSPALMGEW